MKLKTLFAILVMAMFIVSCGGGGSDSGSTSEAPPADDAPAADVTPAGTATISGAIAFSGDAPKPRKVRQDQDCKALHDGDVFADNVVVNDNDTLKNVFVYVKEGLEGKKFAVPSEPVVFDQKGCMYDPHVFGVMAGQTIKILNSDPFLHNIHARPEVNRPFNFGMPKQGDERERSFKKAEVMVFIKCDVHPWMGAYCGVLDHPYYSVSGDDGSFTISNLPAGSYVVEAWHEQYGTQTMNVTVADNETQTADFTFAAQ